MKDLEIHVKLRRDAASVQAITGDMKRIEASTAQAAGAQKQATEQAVQGLSKVAQGQAQLDAAKAKSAALDRDAQGRFVAGMKQSGDAGVAAFGAISISSAAVSAGLTKAIQLAGTFGQAMQEAAARYAKLTGNFSDQRDRLGELATVMGEKPDNAFTLKNASFNKEVGFKPDEGLAFRLQFQNSGAQFAGRTMSGDEYAQYEKQAAALIAARGFDPAQSGDLAGTLAGFKDRTALGANASEDALGKLNTGTAILGRGKGRNSVLVNQFNMAAAASLNEDELKGTFTDSDEVATVVSVAAEKHDAQAAEMVRAAGRGLRDFDGKAKDLLVKAGVTSKTKFIDALKAIAPIVEGEARAQGVKVEDVLKGSFEDGLTREAIGVFINRGVSGGLFEDRANFAKGLQGPKPALEAIDAFKGGERGQKRIADAGVEEAEAEEGAKNSRVAILRQQAIEQLTRDGKIGTTWSDLRRDFMTTITNGAFNPEEHDIRVRQASILAGRAATSGVELAGDPRTLAGTPEQANAYFNRQMDQLGQAGGTPLADPATVRGFDTLAGLLKINNDLLKQMVKPGQVGPPVKQAGPGRVPTR